MALYILYLLYGHTTQKIPFLRVSKSGSEELCNGNPKRSELVIALQRNNGYTNIGHSQTDKNTSKQPAEGMDSSKEISEDICGSMMQDASGVCGDLPAK